MPDSSYFLQSDPAQNTQFSRLWREPPMSAAELDRLADRELQHGHLRAAEHLAWLASSLREAGR